MRNSQFPESICYVDKSILLKSLRSVPEQLTGEFGLENLITRWVVFTFLFEIYNLLIIIKRFKSLRLL